MAERVLDGTKVDDGEGMEGFGEAALVRGVVHHVLVTWRKAPILDTTKVNVFSP